MEPTEEQAAIKQHVADGRTSLMVKAYAGTAKTTTLKMAAPAIKEPALALAFNRKIADELEGALPYNFKVQTLNGAGYGAWLRRHNLRGGKPDARKVGKLVTAIAKDRKTHLVEWQWDAVKGAVEAAMKAGLSPNNIGQPLVQDNEETWAGLIDIPSVDDVPFIRDLAREVLKTSIDLARQGTMSFDDQIYCPVILGGQWAQYPRVFVDEAQDLSPLNHAMLKLVTRQHGLVTAVGDPKQAIYQFRGADARSMENMRQLQNVWQDLALTMTFRCPAQIVARQQFHAPGYRAAPASSYRYPDWAEGRFINLKEGGWGWDFLKSQIPSNAEPGKPPVAILCRNNAPLVSLAFKLIRAGVGCSMLGRDIGTGLVRLCKKLCPDDNVPIVKFARLLTDWQEHESALAHANNNPDRVAKLEDQAECIRATISGASPSTAGDLRNTLHKLFSREGSMVVLSSCHRAKGLEWPVVVHLDPWRIPSKQSRMAALAGDPLPMEQEHNLLYVCETRTQNTLIHANTDQFQQEDKSKWVEGTMFNEKAIGAESTVIDRSMEDF